MTEFIFAFISGLLAVSCSMISFLQFKGKGFLFHNAYIWASKQEREKMDKEPYYRQSAIAFAICAAIFLCMAIEFVLSTGWLWLMVGAVAITLLVYAISSSAKETKH